MQSASVPRNFRIHSLHVPLLLLAAPLLAYIVVLYSHPHLPRLKYYTHTLHQSVRAARGLALTSIFLDFCCLKLCRAGRRCNLHFSSEELQSRIVQVSAAVHFTLTWCLFGKKVETYCPTGPLVWLSYITTILQSSFPVFRWPVFCSEHKNNSQ